MGGLRGGEKGALTPGTLGDAVVLDSDAWREPERILGMRVAMTVVGGRIVYRRR